MQMAVCASKSKTSRRSTDVASQCAEDGALVCPRRPCRDKRQGPKVNIHTVDVCPWLGVPLEWRDEHR